MKQLKAIKNGKEVYLELSEEAEKEIEELEKKICKDCPFKCKKEEKCKIRC